MWQMKAKLIFYFGQRVRAAASGSQFSHFLLGQLQILAVFEPHNEMTYIGFEFVHPHEQLFISLARCHQLVLDGFQMFEDEVFEMFSHTVVISVFNRMHAKCHDTSVRSTMDVSSGTHWVGEDAHWFLQHGIFDSQAWYGLASNRPSYSASFKYDSRPSK